MGKTPEVTWQSEAYRLVDKFITDPESGKFDFFVKMHNAQYLLGICTFAFLKDIPSNYTGFRIHLMLINRSLIQLTWGPFLKC